MEEKNKANVDGKVVTTAREHDGKDATEKVMDSNDFDKAVNEAVNDALKGLQEQIDSLKSAIDEIFVKQNESAAKHDCTLNLNGAVTGETGREAPDKRVDFSKLSYSELCSFLEKHPRAKL
ncbi:MAG: hypothetical protein FWF94_05480 [Oscillospiraceae bacterium]|nr:hypothetical protein [Oscillospiraceae bacterium]